METKIYYFKSEYIKRAMLVGYDVMKDFCLDKELENYVCVYSTPFIWYNDVNEYLDLLFRMCNGEDNPTLGITGTHSSMSVGDIIFYRNKYYMVAGFGFKLLDE